MIKRTLESTFAILLLLSAGVGCGGNEAEEEDAGDSTTEAVLSLHVVHGQTSQQYKEANLEVKNIGLQNAKGQTQMIPWQGGKSLNLLQLKEGIGQAFSTAKIRPGHYNQLWMELGKSHTIRLASGQVHKLEIAGGGKGFVRLPINLAIGKGQRRGVVVNFEGENAIMATRDHFGLPRYVLNPAFSALEREKTGMISGNLTDLLGNPLAGAQVYAEGFGQGQTQGKIIRSALTNQKGAYQLGGLPFGQTYHVVSRPFIGGKSYVTKASPAIQLTQQNPFGKYNQGFEQAPYVGGLQVQLNPKALVGQSDVCSLMQQGLVDNKMLVVSQQQASQSQQSQAKFEQVPSGKYAVQCQRSKLDWAGGTSFQSSKQVQAQVQTSQTSQLQIQY